MSKRKTYSDEDKIWMQRALSLAERGRGYTSPNPLVGCVIVDKNGEVIGEGYHERYGQPHAEALAVKSVKDPVKLNGATVYVTLEPCSHYGKTPPCADLLAGLPVRRIVVAAKDPSSKVNGNGIKKLQECGISVDVGLLEDEAKKQNEFWLHYLNFNKPFVTLKIAQTADGYIAAPNGDSSWISCLQSRKLVHQWRSVYDAVMIGRNTANIDNPSLTVRHVEGRNPRRVVLDGPFELPRKLNLLSDAHEEKTILITYNQDKTKGLDDPMLKMLQSDYFRGDILIVESKEGHVNLSQALEKLAEKGITSVLVEGGQSLSTALIKNNLVDRLQIFIAPKLLGGGTKSILGLGINKMEDVVPFRETTWQQVGSDILITADI
ncbi:MAG: bifunctional diaminohydroxyphosphoribosylaminopyrimidine deaminase/5-amino-6-(5-phosphoribosylamino)uracil reductase RibD [Balneolaceae bacterium]